LLPGAFLFVAMLGCYPEIVQQPVPVTFLLGRFGAGWFEGLFEIVLFGILVKCGTALLHSINERIASTCRARGIVMKPTHRSIVSTVVLLFSCFAATSIGLVDLVAKGYGGLTYAFIALFILPVVTVGIWKIVRSSAG
jgi:uncharacterized membrane protein YkvI